MSDITTKIVAERDSPLRSDEPLVRCERCGHLPCVFCGVGVCDETIDVVPTEEEIHHRRASIEMGNGMSESALSSARARAVHCDGPECTRGWYDGDIEKPPEVFLAENAHARAIVDGGVLWFCSQRCVDAWIEASEFEMCSCESRDDGCTYPDGGRAQNERVLHWMHHILPDDSNCGGLSIDEHGFVSLHLQKEESGGSS